MPGVPTGRACEACRRQKKKCNEANPSCSRCMRLGIECVGSGEKRYKFQVHTARNHRPESQRSSTSLSSPRQNTPDTIQHAPSNDLSILVSAFTDSIYFSKTSDLRFSYTWAYGPVFRHIPARLGQNAALDAAVVVLTKSYRRFASVGGKPTVDELTYYGRALKALRTSLNDPVEARSTNTLCAILILINSQMFIGTNGQVLHGHCEGAAAVLKAKGFRYNPEDRCEMELLQTLRGPVLFEGIFNRKIALTNEEWDKLITNELDGNVTSVGRLLSCLARIPDIAKRGSRALKICDLAELATLRNEVEHLYKASCAPYTELRNKYLETIPKVSNESGERGQSHCSPSEWLLYADWQRMYGMALFTVCLFNGILRCVAGSEERATLQSESARYTDEIIALAEHAAMFRPIGSCYVMITLFGGWVATQSSTARNKIAKIWKDYASDYAQLAGNHGPLDWTSRQLNIIEYLELGGCIPSPN